MINNNKQAGFSLIEAIVALGVFALLAATVSSTAGIGYLSEKQSGERIIAQAYITEGIEATKSIRNRGWSELIDGSHGLQSSKGYWEFNGTEDALDKYTRQIVISSVYRDENSNIVNIGEGNIDLHTKLVTVTVTWELSPGTDNELVVNNYLTNWQSLDWEQTNWANGDGQTNWSDDASYWIADESIDISTAGEIKLQTVGTLPSPYALLMHMDGPRYMDANNINNNSFEDYSGIDPDVNWSNWSEISFGSGADSVAGIEGQAAEISFDWWLGAGGVEQTSIPVEGDTDYQLSFYVKGDISYAYFIVQDDDNYYLKPDGSFTWWFTTNYVDISDEWSQANINFTTKSGASTIKLTIGGLAIDWGQSFAIDEVSLSREVVYDDGPYGNYGYKLPDDNDGPNYDNGNFSDALEFDGASSVASGDAVIITASDSLDISSAITLEAWIRPNDLDNDYKEIINKWFWSGGDYRSYRLTINPSDKLQFYISSDGRSGNGHEYVVTSTNKIEEKEWTHVVGVYDGSEMRIYINGQEKGSLNYDEGIFQSGDNADVMIGSVNGNLDGDYRFEGKIDEVSIESIALSDTEVYDHYINSPLTPESVILWVSPLPMGVFMADKKVAGMHIAGNYLYLALLDKKRVEVFDLSTNPENPDSLGLIITSNKSEDVSTYGNYIYVMTDAAEPGLEIFEYTSTPTDAQYVSGLNLGDTPSGLWIEGDVLYIAIADDEVEVYSLAVDPANPTSLGNFATTNHATDISIYGDYAYVSLDNTTEALQTFDVSLDPSNPNSTNVSAALEEPVGLTTREGYLFLITGGSSRKVLVYNIADNPSAPTALGDFDIADNGWDIETRGSYIYVGLGGSSKGVQVFDMTFMIAGGAGQSNYEVYGTLESSAFDTTSASGFNFISWSETLPSAEENIRVQIKTSPTFEGLESAAWFGASGSNTYFDSGTEVLIPASNSHNGDRYMKYFIHLYGSGDDTPILSNIKINYTP